MSYEDVLLTGLRAAVNNADRNNLVWDIFLGTIATIEELGTYKVMLDGDTTLLTITSMAGNSLTEGDRVYILKVPPNTLYILGVAISLPIQLTAQDVHELTPDPEFTALVATAPSASVSIEATADAPETLVLEDFFERTVVGLQEWGTPDIGGDWITDFFGDGTTIQVDGGYGQIVNDSSYDANTATIIAGISDIKNYAIEIIDMQVTPEPTVESIVNISARNADNSLTMFFFPDGTAEAFLYTGLASVGPVTIPDVTSSQPIDIYMTCVDDHIQVWTALTSVGLNLSDPPLFDETAFDGFAGPIWIDFDGDTAGDESSVFFGEFRIWELG